MDKWIKIDSCIIGTILFGYVFAQSNFEGCMYFSG
jgi:hypothetical protein